VSWHPDLPFCALILAGIFLMYAIPSAIEGIHKYRAGRELARQITAEHEARKALEKLSR
jgi:hypothetical protein